MIMQLAPRLPCLTSFSDEAGREGLEMNFEYELVRKLQGTGGSALIDVLKGIFYCNTPRGAGASALTRRYRPQRSCDCVGRFGDRIGLLYTQEHPLPNLHGSFKCPFLSVPSPFFLFLSLCSGCFAYIFVF